MREGFFRDLYYHEIDRKRWLDNLIKMPISWIIILIGSFFYILESIKSLNITKDVVSFVLCVLIIISLLFTTAFLLRMFYVFGNAYLYIPSPKKLYDRQNLYKSNYLNHHLNDGNEDEALEMSSIYSQNEMIIELEEYYVSCGTNNQEINDRRLKDYFRIRFLLTISIILILILTIINLKLIIK